MLLSSRLRGVCGSYRKIRGSLPRAARGQGRAWKREHTCASVHVLCLNQFINREVGGAEFDDDEELESAVKTVLGHSGLDDFGGDGVSDGDITQEDMQQLYHSQLGVCLSSLLLRL